MEKGGNKKVKVIVCSAENICLGGEVEILISEERLISYFEDEGENFEDFDGTISMMTMGECEEMIKEDGEKECVLMERMIIFYHEKGVYVECMELNTINTPEGSYPELNNIYHKIGSGRNYKLMSKEELEDYKKTNYYEDYTEYGWEIHTVKDFDLEGELTSGYF